MAQFMPISQRKMYSVRRDIEVTNCKVLLRFECDIVEFIANEFDETDNRGGTV